MARIHFNEVSLTAARTVLIDGKKRRRQKRFWQTINPWNTRADGLPKTREDILAELRAEAAAWQRDGDATAA